MNKDVLFTRDVICQWFSLVTWITIFWSRVRWFANDLHEWRSQEWKSLAKHITRDQKIVIHGNECIIVFLTRYFLSWTHNSAKNNHRSFISPLSPRKVFSDLPLWRHHSWSVTSGRALWVCDVIFVDCSCTRKLAQINKRQIFISE